MSLIQFNIILLIEFKRLFLSIILFCSDYVVLPSMYSSLWRSHVAWQTAQLRPYLPNSFSETNYSIHENKTWL